MAEQSRQRTPCFLVPGKVFGTPTKCEIPVSPNTAFVTWMGGTNRVLIAAEVVPVSIRQCNRMFRVYEVLLLECIACP